MDAEGYRKILMAPLGLNDVRLAISLAQALGWYFGGDTAHERRALRRAVVSGMAERACELKHYDVANAFELVKLEVPKPMHEDLVSIQKDIEEAIANAMDATIVC